MTVPGGVANDTYLKWDKQAVEMPLCGKHGKNDKALSKLPGEITPPVRHLARAVPKGA
jgi:hypothetical protein